MRMSVSCFLGLALIGSATSLSLPSIPGLGGLQSIVPPSAISGIAKTSIKAIEGGTSTLISGIESGNVPDFAAGFGSHAIKAALGSYNLIGAGLISAIGENLRNGDIESALPYLEALQKLISAYAKLTAKLAKLAASDNLPPGARDAFGSVLEQSQSQLADFQSQLADLMTEIPKQAAGETAQKVKESIGDFTGTLGKLSNGESGAKIPKIPDSLPKFF